MVQLALSGTACGLAGRAAHAGARTVGARGAAPEGSRPSAAARWLELVNTHTGETLGVAYRTASGLAHEAIGRLEHLLRDHRANEQHPIDTGLYDQLADLARAAGRDPRFEVISGYRSPRTNAALAEQGHGVATHSLHMEGRAIDVRLLGFGCDRLRDLALAAGRGGVGYYERSDFVHIDTGRVRTWSG
jgi:uncharacterized protein YcbK (DUF882 family)